MNRVYNGKKINLSFDFTILALMFAVMVSMALIGIELNVVESTYAMTNFIICYICGIFSIILYICCMTSETSDRKLIVIFELMVFLLAVSTLLTETYISMDGNAKYSVASFILMTIDYLITASFVALFWFYQAIYLRKIYNFGIATKIILSYTIICVIVVLVNIFYPLLFYVDANGYVQYPEISIINVVIDLFWIVFYIIIMARLKTNVRQKLYYMSYIFFPLAMIVLSVLWIINGIEFRFDSTLCIAMLVPLYLIFFKIYQDQSRLLSDKEKELSEKNMQMMLSQIQPHFLYNALSAISAIPNTPDETRDALSDFGKYLRGNLNSINVKTPIPFMQEIKHVDTYLGLEKLRFGDKLVVEYEFNERDFCVPALSIQMFVENAVKHGITKKENGGTLLLKTELVAKNYVLIIADNGVGFNVNELDLERPDAHIGIKNARNRIKSMVNGTVEIQSEIGEGTTVIIKIPKTDGE